MRRPSQGFTLLEAVALLSVVGVLLAAFLPVYLRGLHTSRLAEPVEVLASLHRGAASYWRTPQGDARRRRCLPPPAGPTPVDPTPEARPFQPPEEEATTWRALDPTLAGRPLRYSYRYLPTDSGCGLKARPGTPLLRLQAIGDLDGDGVRSTFERSATVDADGALVPLGPLLQHRRAE